MDKAAVIYRLWVSLGSAAIEQMYALRTVFNLQEHLNNKAVLQDASACDIHSSFLGNNRFDRDLVQEDPLPLQPNCLSMSGEPYSILTVYTVLHCSAGNLP